MWCFLQHQGDREPAEGRRHQVADLLGGVQRVQSDRVLRRHPALLDSVLLAAQGTTRQATQHC